MKIFVVFARQRLRADVKSVKIERETYRFRFGRRLPYTLFQQHAQILSATTRPRPHSEGLSLPREAKACICKGATVILRLPDEHSLRPQRQLQCRGSSTPDTSWLAYSVFTDIGPFSVDNRMSGVPLPYSIRRCSSSQVFRASLQMLAWQLIGECPFDSTRKLD